MTTFRTSAGNELKLTTIEGTVLSVEDRDNVVVNQTQGTTRYNATLNQTFKQAGDVYSEIIKSSKVWIRDHSGKDRQVDISDTPVPLRAGHQLRVIKVSRPEAELGYYWAAKNLSTDDVVVNKLATDMQVSDSLGLTKPEFLKAFLLKPARNAVVAWSALSILYAFTNDRHHGLGRSFGEMSAMLFIFIPFAIYYGFKKRKDHIKPMAEITAQVKAALA
ncbi:MAG: hypothetical protein EON54_25095 [Alcaligenaceae bacterium]|nr:MAG: hypothetical protein EON54_25095 [Alcaligenaceae bacterium]